MTNGPRSKLLLVATLALSIAAGCTTINCPTDTGRGYYQAAVRLDSEAEIVAAVNDTIASCGEKLARFACVANRDAQIGRSISIIGLFAGTVAVPTLTAASSANAIWIAGSGATAGAANELSKSMEESGFSGTGAARTRRELVTKMENDLALALDPAQPIEVRRNAARLASVRCAIADAVPH